ncbi:MAG: hypothetical protein E7Z94_09475, partial [Actinomyces ruminicola]|nr:hypothetical protein [Actinomyces ruminicola]
TTGCTTPPSRTASTCRRSSNAPWWRRTPTTPSPSWRTTTPSPASPCSPSSSPVSSPPPTR